MAESRPDSALLPKSGTIVAMNNDHQEHCQCGCGPRIAEHFDQRIEELTAEAGGEFPEMIDVSRTLLEQLNDVAEVRPTVLELGCGSGALTVALVKRGAARARGMDLSPGMLSVAVRRAEAAGVGDRVAFGVGDGAAEALEPADWVVLDRAICCYPDMPKLVMNGMGAARSRIGFTVPITRGWRGLVNRVMWSLENLPLVFGRPGCPTFAHSVDRIERLLAEAGFRERSSRRLGLWHAAVWERGSVAA